MRASRVKMLLFVTPAVDAIIKRAFLRFPLKRLVLQPPLPLSRRSIRAFSFS